MNDSTEVVPYLTSAAIIVYAQKWLKNFEFYQNFVKAFPGADKWAHRVFAGVASFIAAVGIHYTYTGDYSTGWQVQLNIPDLISLVHAGFDWVKVFVLQQMAYDATKNRIA